MATFPALPCCRRSRVKGMETLVIETSSGQQITLETSPASILIEDGNGNSIRMDATGIALTTSEKLTIIASEMEISAGKLTVNAGLTNLSGVVRADTVQANTVIATNIVQGSGNLW